MERLYCMYEQYSHMPSEAVALDVTVLGLDSDDTDRVRETVQSFGFHPHPISDEIIGDIINYQPFEHTDSNITAVEKCVDEIGSQLPDADVTYEIRKNRDAGRTVEKVCNLRVDGETPEQKEEKEKRREELRGSWKADNAGEDGY